jgi:hypothetical protein
VFCTAVKDILFKCARRVGNNGESYAKRGESEQVTKYCIIKCKFS